MRCITDGYVIFQENPEGIYPSNSGIEKNRLGIKNKSGRLKKRRRIEANPGTFKTRRCIIEKPPT